LLRFIFGLVALAIVSFLVFYYFSAPVENSSPEPVVTEAPAAPESTSKVKHRRGEDDEGNGGEEEADEDSDNDQNEQSEEDADAQRRMERRMDRF
jgi:hypothetical protein